MRLRGNDVQIVKAGDGGIDLLRAACAVIWTSGRAIYGLNVPESLYTDAAASDGSASAPVSVADGTWPV